VSVPDQLAVISDVHANRWALEAVLADIQRRGIDRIFNLGDSVYGPLDPSGTAALLMAPNIRSVSGNEDRIIVDSYIEGDASSTLTFVRDQLTIEQTRWIGSLPVIDHVDEETTLFHGIPGNDEVYLLRRVEFDRVRSSTPDEVASMIGETSGALLLCGHDHTPGEMILPDGRLVVNPGSVGMQAYTDDNPAPHAIENPTPHARYAVLTRETSSWRVEHLQIDYDWDFAARVAAGNGRDDVAEWLRTGKAGR
jgi:predicted phosphodiesterase